MGSRLSELGSAMHVFLDLLCLNNFLSSSVRVLVGCLGFGLWAFGRLMFHCCQFGPEPDSRAEQLRFDMFDTNDDGLLSELEVQQLVEHGIREAGKWWRPWHWDKSYTLPKFRIGISFSRG